MTDTRTAPVRTAVTVVSTYQYGAGPWRDTSDSRLFDDFEPFAGGTAVFPQWQAQDDRVCSFGGIGSGGRGRRVSREIQVGTVWTNTWAAINDGFAEGGYKQSGIGRLRGPWPSPTSRKPRPSSTPFRRSRANPITGS